MSLDPQRSHLNRLQTLTPRLRKGPEVSFTQWQQDSRAALCSLLGLPFETCLPRYREEWRKCHTAYEEIRFLFESEEDVTVCAHLLLPKLSAGSQVPLVICLQGHTTGAHLSLGVAKHFSDIADLKSGDRDFARQVLARGQAALVIEQRGFGERGGTPKPACDQPAAQALLLGRTLIGERCWDVSRAIDVVLERFPQIAPEKIAIMGNSGGGTAAFYAAAVDTRIAACMPSCAISSYYASIGVRLHCACNYIPGIAAAFDMGDIAGLIAPRPLVVVSGRDDKLFPAGPAAEQVALARQLYREAGTPDKIQHIIGPEGHRFYAALSWPVFDELTRWHHE